MGIDAGSERRGALFAGLVYDFSPEVIISGVKMLCTGEMLPCIVHHYSSNFMNPNVSMMPAKFGELRTLGAVMIRKGRLPAVVIL